MRLGRGFYAAYLDTIDYEGEAPDQAVQEIEDTLHGQYEAFIHDASFVAEVNGEPASFSLVTRWRNQPLLAYSVTHSHHANQGLATTVIKRSINTLLLSGHQDLYLFVTQGNDPALHLYEKLGFVPITESSRGSK